MCDVMRSVLIAVSTLRLVLASPDTAQTISHLKAYVSTATFMPEQVYSKGLAASRRKEIFRGDRSETPGK
jgi:hypothetical protein